MDFIDFVIVFFVKNVLDVNILSKEACGLFDGFLSSYGHKRQEDPDAEDRHG